MKRKAVEDAKEKIPKTPGSLEGDAAGAQDSYSSAHRNKDEPQALAFQARSTRYDANSEGHAEAAGAAASREIDEDQNAAPPRAQGREAGHDASPSPSRDPVQQPDTTSTHDAHSDSPAVRLVLQIVRACELRRINQHLERRALVGRNTGHVSSEHNSLLRQAQGECFRLLCKLTIEDGSDEHPLFDQLPNGWINLVEAVEVAIADSKDALASQAKVEEEMLALVHRLECVHDERTKTLLSFDVKGSWPPEAVEAGNDAGDAEGCLRQKQHHLGIFKMISEGRVAEENRLGDRLLATLDDTLVSAGLLEKGEDVAAEGDEDQHDHHDAPQREDDNNCAAGRRSSIRPSSHSQQERSAREQRSNSNAAPPDLRDRICAGRLGEYKRARKAWSQASHAFHDVRNQCAARLDVYLAARERGDLHDIRTDFDGQYFLDRAKANRKLAKAASEWEHARKAAQMVGALAKQQTSNFADRGDDGYLDDDFDSPARLDRSTIERWQTDEGQREIDGEEQWLQGLPSTVSASVATESSCSQFRYAEHKQRRLIERWRIDQEIMRTQVLEKKSDASGGAGLMRGLHAGRFASCCGVTLHRPVSERASPRILEARLQGGVVRFSMGSE